MKNMVARASKKQNKIIDRTVIFICYARKQEGIANDIVASIEAHHGYKCSWDKNVQSGDEYFSIIDTMIEKSDVGILILTGESMNSAPVMREVGLLIGHKKQIILYIPEPSSIDKTDIPAMLNKCVQCFDEESLFREVSNHSRFNDIFVHKTEEISLERFREAFSKNTDICKLQLKIPLMEPLDDIRFSRFKDSIRFGCILVLMAKNSGPREYIDMCPVKKEERGGLRRDQCTVEQTRLCAIFADPQCEDNPETVLLNKLIDCSHSDYDDFYFIVEYVLPVHKEFGLTFKCFVDVSEHSLVDRVEQLLKTKLDPSKVSRSGSFESSRIYLLLDDNPEHHLLNIRIPETDSIRNNYICPSCVK